VKCDSHVQSFLVVVSQISSEGAIDGHDIIRDPVETLLLKCSIEPLDVGIVVGFADPGVSMILQYPRDEPSPELRSVVALEHLEPEPSFFLRLSNEPETRCGVHSSVRPRIRPSRTDVDQCEDIEAFLLIDHSVDRVHLDQISWFPGYGPIDMGMEPFPGTPLLHETVPVDGPPDRIQGDFHPLIQEDLVDNLARPSRLQAESHNPPDDFLR